METQKLNNAIVGINLRFMTWLNERVAAVTPEEIVAAEPQGKPEEGATILGDLDNGLRALYVVSAKLENAVRSMPRSSRGERLPNDVLMQLMAHRVVLELFWAEVQLAIPTALGGGVALRGWNVVRNTTPPPPRPNFGGILVDGILVDILKILEMKCTDPDCPFCK
jgi:hypothetical protein